MLVNVKLNGSTKFSLEVPRETSLELSLEFDCYGEAYMSVNEFVSSNLVYKLEEFLV